MGGNKMKKTIKIFGIGAAILLVLLATAPVVYGESIETTTSKLSEVNKIKEAIENLNIKDLDIEELDNVDITSLKELIISESVEICENPELIRDSLSEIRSIVGSEALETLYVVEDDDSDAPWYGPTDTVPVDIWSLAHFLVGLILGILGLSLPVTLVLLIIWEIIEPYICEWLGLPYDEIPINILMDIIIGLLGWLIGQLLGVSFLVSLFSQVETTTTSTASSQVLI